MECCYPVDCGEYAVIPVLQSPNCSRKYCAPEPSCPRLPRCHKPVYYCCEPISRKKTPYDCSDAPPQKGCCSPSLPRHQCAVQPNCESCCKPVKTKYIMPCYRYEDGRIVRKFPVSAFKRNGMQDVEHSTQGTANFLVRHPRDVAVECEVCLNPVKVADPIKSNQPTVLMRRACEVACGTRKRKPFVVSSYAADPHNEIRRFHSEDERGNCCFHFERQKPTQCEPCWAPTVHQRGDPCQPQQCQECAYVDCVYAHPTDSMSCCHFCR